MDKQTDFMKVNFFIGLLQGVGLLLAYFILNITLYLKLRAFLSQKRRLSVTAAYRGETIMDKRERKSTMRLIILSFSCIIGYFPNKLANNSLLYVLSIADFNTYIPISNMLIWISHALKLPINVLFDDEFRSTFYIRFGIKGEKEISRKETSFANRTLSMSYSNAQVHTTTL